MDQLIAKITSLSYELFGIFLPGLIFIFISIWVMWCLGDLVPLFTFGYIDPLVFSKYSESLGIPVIELRTGLVMFLGFASYFFGHLIFWVSRLGKSKPQPVDATSLGIFQRWKVTLGRILSCMLFSIPKPSENYYPELEPMLKAGAEFLEIPNSLTTWRTFYPVAKSRLTRDLSFSLVTTYQNKYTLHRSLCTVAAIWFWLITSSLIAALILSRGTNYHFRAAPLIVSAVGCICVTGGFSASYMYNWIMFGNTIITETFMLSKAKTSPADTSKGASGEKK